MKVEELITLLQGMPAGAVVVTGAGLELRAADVQTAQMKRFEGKSWVGTTHGATEWCLTDDEPCVTGVVIG